MRVRERSHGVPAWRVALGAVVLTVGPGGAAPAVAQGPLGPLNDLGALSQGSGQTPDMVAVKKPPAPPVEATPRADCGPGSRREPGIQGRVPAGTNRDGFICNMELLSHQGASGGFKTLRYIDETGRECAYYDTALLFPTNALNAAGTSLGVKVLDMTDPAHPVLTDTLTALPMITPHESLALNTKRGLIGAVTGNPSTYPGDVAFYDAHADCRHPVLTFTGVIARLGHESGFAPDGRTFYATGTATKSITAIDVTDPRAPSVVWQGNVVSHGMTLSDDGNRGYVADPLNHQLLIMDTSEVQARKKSPQVREISRTTWSPASIPQNAIRFTQHGHPYMLEFDEYTASTLGNGSADDVGAARILDIADETAPKVIAQLRLQVDQPADHKAASGDPGTLSPAQGYAAHYCNVPQETDPTIVACSFIASGLRVFDISDVTKPKEIGYYVAPSAPQIENGYDGSNYAMSQPTFAPGRKEIWYTDGASGFNVLRMTNGAWPAALKPVAPARTCTSRRAFTATLRVAKGQAIRSATATLGGKRVKVTIRGRAAAVKVRFAGRVRPVVKLVIRVRLRSGRTVSTTRTYHPCARRS